MASIHKYQGHETELEGSCTPEDVYSALIEAKLNCSIRVLGSQLGLDPADLDAIERDSLDQQLQLLKVLEKCNNRAKHGLTWNWIADVLRKPALTERRVAAQIEQHYQRRHSSVSSSTLSPDLSSSTSSTDFAWPSPTHMDIDEQFSIPAALNMIHLNLIHVNIDSKELGIALGLSAVDIEDISAYDKREHRQRLMEVWYSRATSEEFSRENLQKAIVKVSRRRESYDSAVSVPSTPNSPTGIEAQFVTFNKRFGQLQRAARKELELKHNAVELVREELNTLPREIMKENYKFIQTVTKPKGVTKFTDLTNLFQHLHLYCWSFFEYKVLEVLINNNCSDELQERMSMYVSDIQTFKEKTTISDFIKHAKQSPYGILAKKKRNAPPQTFKTLLTKHNIDPDTYTLLELEAFRSETSNRVCLFRTLSECAFQLYTVKHGSIIIEWIFPEELAEALMSFIDSVDGKKLLQEYFIEQVLIDSKTVPTIFLLTAVKAENWERVKELIQDKDSDIDVNSSDVETDQTVLIYTAMSGNAEIAKLLLERGADVDITDKLQRTALLHASHEGHITIVKLLLEKGARPNHQANGGWTALMLASYRGHVEVVELLLEYGSDVNLTTQHGWTALQRVCLYNLTRYPKAKYKPSERRGEIAKILIDHGTDIKKIDKQGRTPLIAASDSGFADIVKLLVEKIAEFPDEERQKYLDYKKHFSWTALMSASEKGHAEVVKILIEAGGSRSLTKEKDEVSALHIAVQNGHVEVVEALTHKMDKDDLNARDNYGMTPLILATQKKSEQLLNVLIHAGAEVNAQSKDGDEMTALMFAVKVGSFDVVKLLVENSANLFAMNSRKETVLEMAKNSSKDIQDYLAKKCKEAEEKLRRQKVTV